MGKSSSKSKIVYSTKQQKPQQIYNQSIIPNKYPNSNLLNNISNKHNAEDNMPEQVIKLSDEQFYMDLKKYHPICYRGNGSPFFMKNQGYCQSLTCLWIADSLLILTIALFIVYSQIKQRLMNDMQAVEIILLIDVATFIMLNISYLMTQLMNPGIRNLTAISQQEYEKEGKVFCEICYMYRTKRMRHCRECKVCVENLDHHCGFFNKCIAGPQQYAFHCCMFMMLAAFLMVLITLVLIMT